MKKIIILLFSIFLYSDNLLQIYLRDGIAAVEAKLQSGLANKDFWKQELSGLDLKYGYYSHDSMLVVVDKTKQQLILFEQKNNKLKPKFEQSVITGLMGNKNKEGDLKTPIGVYEVLNKMVPPDNYYGPWAFVLNYPNLYDRVRKKTGSGIWIHGFPLEGDVRYDAYKTKGCVVMTNDVLLDFEEIIKNNKTYVLINENEIASTNIDEISTLLANLFEWKNAWTNNDVKAYLSFYSNEFIKNDGTKINEFSEQKKAIFSRNQQKIIKFKDINISPYPNLDKRKLFKITFYENYSTSTYNFNGEKTLYVELKNNKMSILTEQ